MTYAESLQPQIATTPFGRNNSSTVVYATNQGVELMGVEQIRSSGGGGENRKDRERILTINELMQTELDYYLELKTCYDAFMSDDFLVYQDIFENEI